MKDTEVGISKEQGKQNPSMVIIKHPGGSTRCLKGDVAKKWIGIINECVRLSALSGGAQDELRTIQWQEVDSLQDILQAKK